MLTASTEVEEGGGNEIHADLSWHSVSGEGRAAVHPKTHA